MSTTKVTHTGVHKYSIPGKRAQDALADDEKELFELCQLAGVEMSPAVFRILLDLLKHSVSPLAIVQMLKTMVRTKSPNSTTMTLISDSSRSTAGVSSLGMSSKGVSSGLSSSSGLTTSATYRKGTTSSLSSGGGSVPSSARSSSSVSDSSKKGSRIGSGSSRLGSGSSSGGGRQRSARDATGQRQPKS